jgi:hypothetical protein
MVFLYELCKNDIVAYKRFCCKPNRMEKKNQGEHHLLGTHGIGFERPKGGVSLSFNLIFLVSYLLSLGSVKKQLTMN